MRNYYNIVGDTLEWNFSNLLPNETQNIEIIVSVATPPIVNIGEHLTPIVIINPIINDTFPIDNIFGLKQLVIGSFDPNDKSELTKTNLTPSQISTGEFLSYLIRFQNTGTDTAFNITIKDTLDSNLDWSTFEMISFSHDYSLNIFNQNIIIWRFDNILLPCSTSNEQASHGYICYRIKPKTTLQVGDKVKNIANIFFDYNLPVLTNTSILEVQYPVIIDKYSQIQNNINVYPNPASNNLIIEITDYNNQSKLEIFDIVGQTIYSTILEKQKVIDISNLPFGVYFIKVSSDNVNFVKRFIKQ